jgi:DNA-directed RNA polymerase specialized sigma24 family protein
MIGTRRITEQNSATYAAAKDFCQVFEQEMDRLYMLSFLLTADHTMAERCFVGGLEDSAKSSRVFKEWAHSWARRMIVQNAVQMIGPQPANNQAVDRSAEDSEIRPIEISAVAGLPAFERFVFVLSVLESYPVQDCALLLHCTRGEATAARARALQQIGRAAERNRLSTDTVARSGDQVTPLAVKLEAVPGLGTSA